MRKLPAIPKGYLTCKLLTSICSHLSLNFHSTLRPPCYLISNILPFLTFTYNVECSTRTLHNKQLKPQRGSKEKVFDGWLTMRVDHNISTPVGVLEKSVSRPVVRVGKSFESQMLQFEYSQVEFSPISSIRKLQKILKKINWSYLNNQDNRATRFALFMAYARMGILMRTDSPAANTTFPKYGRTRLQATSLRCKQAQCAFLGGRLSLSKWKTVFKYRGGTDKHNNSHWARRRHQSALRISDVNTGWILRPVACDK